MSHRIRANIDIFTALFHSKDTFSHSTEIFTIIQNSIFHFFLDLLNSHNSVLPKLLQQQVNKNNIQHQLLTSVNNDAVNDTSMNMNCDHHESCDNGTPSSDLVFNSLMGLQPQMLMLPSVMIQDANSLQLSLQQFPLLNLPSATVTSSNSNNNDTQKLSEHQHSKELIQCKSCVLIPPNPNHPAPTTRERFVRHLRKAQ